jgi:predicted ArsR family transcriptional regulator
VLGRRSGWEESLDRVAVLADGVRRRVYSYARTGPAPVTREKTAQAVGISRKLAAFHLDKLVSAGLLTTRPVDRAAHRRVGRTPKEYVPSPPDIRVNSPVRRHELLAQILADAVAGADPEESPAGVAGRLARERGRADGEAARGSADTASDGFAAAADVMLQHGYEPMAGPDGSLRLRNCVFAPVAERSRDLVCGLHHAYLSGLLEGLGAVDVTAVQAPAEDACCVELCSTARETDPSS